MNRIHQELLGATNGKTTRKNDLKYNENTRQNNNEEKATCKNKEGI